MSKTILERYLNEITTNHMDDLLSGYEVITYTNPDDIEIGLLRYKTAPKGKAFLFKFPDEDIRVFHTVGMEFPIKIFFFNSKKEIVYSTGKVNPGIEIISSNVPAKYAVEIP
jgi:uncharacterized membrane protein (UPF0127 family)